jgi:hypothetical protein
MGKRENNEHYEKREPRCSLTLRSKLFCIYLINPLHQYKFFPLHSQPEQSLNEQNPPTE